MSIKSEFKEIWKFYPFEACLLIILVTLWITMVIKVATSETRQPIYECVLIDKEKQ